MAERTRTVLLVTPEPREREREGGGATILAELFYCSSIHSVRRAGRARSYVRNARAESARSLQSVKTYVELLSGVGLPFFLDVCAVCLLRGRASGDRHR